MSLALPLPLLLPALLLGARPALAAPDQRYHAIVISHDNIVVVEDDASGPAYAVPSLTAGRKGLRVVADDAESDLEIVTRDPALYRLDHTTRDALRFEGLLARYTHPGLLTRLGPDHRGPPLPASDQHGIRDLNTLDGVRRAFHDTACRIADLDGEPRAGCEAAPAPDEARATGRGRVDDVVFIVFSGHGLPQGLILRDGLLTGDELQALVRDLDADLSVVILDACFGASYSGDDSSRHKPIRALQGGPLGGPARVAVFNAANTIPEVEQLRSGMLSHVILSGLMGAADDDADGRIRYEELADFYLLNTSGAGEFQGRSAAPLGNHRAVLFDHRMARRDVEIVSVQRKLGGRLLFTADDGALGEINVSRRPLHQTRFAELHLPVDPGRAEVDLYFLPREGGDQARTLLEPDQDLLRMTSRIDRFDAPPAAPDPYTGYLEGTQRQGRLFASQAAPLQTLGVGNRLTAAVQAGYHRSPAFGRIEDADVLAEGDGQRGELYRFLQETEPAGWNLASLALVTRAHGLGMLHAELRGEVEWSPATRVIGQDVGLFMGRLLGGAGISSHLGLRGLDASATVGGGPLLLRTYQSQEPTFTLTDPLPQDGPALTGFAGLSLRTVTPRLPPLVLELDGLWDRVGVCEGWSESACDGPPQIRDYRSLRFSLGFELAQWPR